MKQVLSAVPALLLLLLLSGCRGETPAPIVREIEVTATPVPTAEATSTSTPTETPLPTETPVPLADLDLSDVLYREGDLPAGLSTAQLRDFAPGKYDGLPEAEQELYLQFERDGEPAMGLAVFLYSSEDALLEAYEQVVDGMTDEARPTDAVGERATELELNVSMPGLVTHNSVSVVYIRCSALVDIGMSGTSDLDAALAYARNLDRRIQPLVCR